MVPYALQQPGLGPHSLRLGEAIYHILAFFAALPPGEFPHTVQLAPLLARISTPSWPASTPPRTERSQPQPVR